MSDTRGERELERAFDRLEQETPDRVTRAIRWLRSPEARWVRLPAGIVLLLLGIVGPFVPVAGIEFLPFAFLLIAQDVPFLRRPVARAVLWLEDRWIASRRWWRKG